MATNTHFKQVFSKIEKYGFLLESDPRLPSVVSIITGAPVRGSWWSHPMAQTIFQVNEKLEDHSEVLITKLLSGKVTFVHRDLWSEVVVIGKAHEPWQTRSLTSPARELLKTVQAKNSIRSDHMLSPVNATKPKMGDAARELEQKLLIHAEQFHTETGAHAKLLETWDHWANRTGFVALSISPDDARHSLEARLDNLNVNFGGAAKLPWKTNQ